MKTFYIEKDKQVEPIGKNEIISLFLKANAISFLNKKEWYMKAIVISTDRNYLKLELCRLDDNGREENKVMGIKDFENAFILKDWIVLKGMVVRLWKISIKGEKNIKLPVNRH